jgi:protein-S-isoprenylcysteine O-methyltransferase Ste14
MLQLKIPPPIYALTAALIMWLLSRYMPLWHWIDPPYHQVGWLLILLASFADVSSLWLFFRNHTTPNPMHPERASELVTSGAYRFTRNPMYLGLLLMLLGWAIVLRSVSPFFMLPVLVWVLTAMQIKPEEVMLEEKFSEQYRDYKKRVRRWL